MAPKRLPCDAQASREAQSPPCRRPARPRGCRRRAGRCAPRRWASASCSTRPSPHSTTVTESSSVASRSRSSTSARGSAGPQPVGVDVHQRHRPPAGSAVHPGDHEGRRGDRRRAPQPGADALGQRGLAGAERAASTTRSPARSSAGQPPPERRGCPSTVAARRRHGTTLREERRASAALTASACSSITTWPASGIIDHLGVAAARRTIASECVSGREQVLVADDDQHRHVGERRERRVPSCAVERAQVARRPSRSACAEFIRST